MQLLRKGKKVELKKQIIVSVKRDIYSDQRVQKVYNSLQNHHYTIDIISLFSSIKDIAFLTYEIKTFFKKGFLFFAEFNLRLFLILLFKVKKADILLANDLDTLLPNYLIKKLKGNSLVFDSHEIFSELPNINSKLKKCILTTLEKYLIPKVDKFYTVSHSYAQWFYENYKVKPEVIMNIPIINEAKIDKCPANLPKKFIIYQGYIGKYRGLEHAMKAMEFIDDYSLLIVGDGERKNYLEKLKKSLPWKEKIIFYGKVTPLELTKITPHAALGLSIEEKVGKSIELALPNKIFDYINANIPVVVSDLFEMKAIVNKYKIGEIIENNSPKELANKINSVLKNGKEYYKPNLKRCIKMYNWENQEKKLLSIFKDL